MPQLSPTRSLATIYSGAEADDIPQRHSPRRSSYVWRRNTSRHSLFSYGRNNSRQFSIYPSAHGSRDRHSAYSFVGSHDPVFTYGAPNYSSDTPYNTRPSTRSSTQQDPYFAVDPFQWRRPQQPTHAQPVAYTPPSTGGSTRMYAPYPIVVPPSGHAPQTVPGSPVQSVAPQPPVVIARPEAQQAPHIHPIRPLSPRSELSYSSASYASSVLSSWDRISISSPGAANALATPVFHFGPTKAASNSFLSRTHAIMSGLFLYLFDIIPVTRVFEDADLSMPDIKEMLTTADDVYLLNWYGPQHRNMSPAIGRFKVSWDDFVNSLMSEWQNQNILSVLLLSAVLTMLQIGGIEGDPVSRTGALLSLVCALMSLLYGCIYMSRFGTMNKLHKAASWAEEARKTRTSTLWNVWVFLAMPATWLAWSIIFFSASILSYIWRTGSIEDPEDPIRLSPHAELGPRIAVTAVFSLGLLYFLLIMNTLRQYGSSMDRAWRAKAIALRTQPDLSEKGNMPEVVYIPSAPPPIVTPRSYQSTEQARSSTPHTHHPVVVPFPHSVSLQRTGSVTADPDDVTPLSTPYRNTVAAPESRPLAFDEPQIISTNVSAKLSKTVNIIKFESSGEILTYERPDEVNECSVYDSAWSEFIELASRIRSGTLPINDFSQASCETMWGQILGDFIDTWNAFYFKRRNLIVSAVWSEDHPPESHSHMTNDDGSAPPSQPSVLITLRLWKDRLSYGTLSSRSSDRARSTHRSTAPNLGSMSAPRRSSSRSSSSSSSASVAAPAIDPPIPPQTLPFQPESLRDPLHYQDAPGPYFKALEISRSFPEIFYRRVYRYDAANDKVISQLHEAGLETKNVAWTLDIANIWRDAWDRFATDLRLALAGKFPIPTLSEDDCMKMRPLIIADLMYTWNQKYFMKRGVEVVLSLDDEDMQQGSESGASAAWPTELGERNGRGYTPMPYVLVLNAKLHGLPMSQVVESLPPETSSQHTDLAHAQIEAQITPHDSLDLLLPPHNLGLSHDSESIDGVSNPQETSRQHLATVEFMEPPPILSRSQISDAASAIGVRDATEVEPVDVNVNNDITT